HPGVSLTVARRPAPGIRRTTYGHGPPEVPGRPAPAPQSGGGLEAAVVGGGSEGVLVPLAPEDGVIGLAGGGVDTARVIVDQHLVIPVLVLVVVVIHLIGVVLAGVPG